jgi:hypothetical protein
MVGKTRGRKFAKWCGILLTCTSVAFSSFNAKGQERINEKKEEEKISKIDLSYLNFENNFEYSADRINELEDALVHRFNRNFSTRRMMVLESMKISTEKRDEYNNKISKLGRRGLFYGGRDFVRSSEIGLAIENLADRLEEKAKVRLAKVHFDGKEDGKVTLYWGIKMRIPNSYAYAGTDLSIRYKKIADVELRALPSWLDLRLRTTSFDGWDVLGGAKTQYGFSGEDDKFLYTRLSKGNRGDYLDDERYAGFELRAGRINGKDDLQALFVLSLPTK